MIYSRTYVNSIPIIIIGWRKNLKEIRYLLFTMIISSITGEIAGETFIVCRKHRDECRFSKFRHIIQERHFGSYCQTCESKRYRVARPSKRHRRIARGKLASTLLPLDVYIRRCRSSRATLESGQ